jgi:hypothetical protein
MNNLNRTKEATLYDTLLTIKRKLVKEKIKVVGWQKPNKQVSLKKLY